MTFKMMLSRPATVRYPWMIPSYKLSPMPSKIIIGTRCMLMIFQFGVSWVYSFLFYSSDIASLAAVIDFNDIYENIQRVCDGVFVMAYEKLEMTIKSVGVGKLYVG